MLVRFVDTDQKDDQGRPLEIGHADVTVPRAGDEQILVFPNMPPQVYIVQKIIRHTRIGGGGSNDQSQNTEHLPPATQQLLAQSSPEARQMVLQQLSGMQSQSQPQQDTREQILVVLKKMSQPNNTPQATTHAN